MTDHTYRVVVTREDGAWLADVPELEGAHTYARNLPGLIQAVREVIAMVEDLPEGAETTLNLAYEYHTGDRDVDEITARLRADRERIRREEKQLTEATAEVARELVSRRGMSVRDAATLLGVAPQRISQVAPTAVPRWAKGPTRNPARRASPDATSPERTGRKAS